MKLTSKNLVPPGGWYFEQGRYRIEGDTFSSLVANVTAHRVSNSIAVGNPANEVEQAIAARWPQGSQLPPAPALVERPGFWASAANCAKALLGLALSSESLASQGEADRRAAICASCHNNQHHGGFCATCQRVAANIFGSVTIGSKRTSSDSRLKACSLCNCQNSTQVWFPLSALHVDDSNRNAYPSMCWKKDMA